MLDNDLKQLYSLAILASINMTRMGVIYGTAKLSRVAAGAYNPDKLPIIWGSIDVAVTTLFPLMVLAVGKWGDLQLVPDFWSQFLRTWFASTAIVVLAGSWLAIRARDSNAEADAKKDDETKDLLAETMVMVGQAVIAVFVLDLYARHYFATA